MANPTFYDPYGLRDQTKPSESYRSQLAGEQTDVARQMRDLSAMLLDPQSQFYSQFRDYLKTVTPNIGTNALLAPLVASGGNYGASTVQAGQLRKDAERKRNDFLNSAVTGFASGNIGLGSNLLGGAGNVYGNLGNIELGYSQLDVNKEAQQGGVLDFLAPILGSIGGNLLAPGSGGATGGGGASSYAGGNAIKPAPFYPY